MTGIRVTAVLPSIYPLWTERCIATMDEGLRTDTLIVDNTEHNRGVAGSWNLGIDCMEQRRSDWLILVSASMRFGAPGGRDFLAELVADTDSPAVEALFLGWHLIAFRRDTIERVGRFDEVFYPGYYEDIDYSRRAALAFHFAAPYWRKVEVDASHAGHAHGILLGGVEVQSVKQERRYMRKWGGPKGAETYRHPYGDVHLDHTFTGPHA